ncbi:MAG TPA: TonB-dependent receptor [Vicinamibacterales bacterium]|nr:TonB-dependent receptor [Vicinamibacterales bacterium]
MKQVTRMAALAVVGSLGLLCTSASPAGAQTGVDVRPVTHIASVPAGSIQGVVLDERGIPVAGATISALGATSAFAITDRSGRFELRTLSPGPYIVRAHLAGFVAPRGQVIDVRPSARASSSIALRHAGTGTTPYPLLAAGIGDTAEPQPAPEAAASPSSATSAGGDDHGEVAWRMRHARRGVLKDTTIPLDLFDDDSAEAGAGSAGFFTRASESSGRLAADFLTGTPFSGQVNLLTTGSFDSPQQLFSGDNFSHSTTYLALGAPVGEHADWAARAALTQGDLSSWIVAGEYTTRAPARHRYDIGVSYSTQRYEGGNFATLRDVTDGSRNAGALYGFDTFSVLPSLTVSYGARYARYDYIDGASLVSPRLAVTLAPSDHFRVSTMVSSRATAPGAEEFMPRMDSGIWLPPQRTFSSLVAGRPFEAERTNHAEVEMERDVASATVSVRVFRQHVNDQLATLFGINTTALPETVGHYYLTNVGGVDASGVSAGIRAALANRVHGSVEYTLTHARLTTPDSDNLAYLLVFAPSAVRPDAEQIHDVATSIETDVPETSTRVIVLYRVSNAFAHAPVAPGSPTPSVDTRFDVQVRQSLPFMDFSTAKWEALVAVRNFFRDAAAEQSVYDELLVVRPPKRIVGGLTLKF